MAVAKASEAGTTTPPAAPPAAPAAAVEPPAAPPAAPAPKPEAKPKGYTVTGAAVVLRTDDGTERYLYRGAPVDESAFSKDSIKHAVSVGLIEKAK